jgi:predicted O-methyltransferase YrrM
MEPYVASQSWGEWANPNENKFLFVGSHKNCLNAVQLQIKTIPSVYPTFRKDSLISILSSKYFDEGHIKRINFIRELEKLNLNYIDIYGRENYHQLNNYKGRVINNNKEQCFELYKYSFQAENNWEHNYATEKIWESIVCETLCFYWGCPNLEEYLDPLSFVRLDLDNIEESIKTIEKAIKEDWWSQRIDIIRKEKHKIINEIGFFPNLQKIIKNNTCIKLNLKIDEINKQINESQFYQNYNKYYNNVDRIIGREHYSLFAAIGAQLTNGKIIEIGTCTGQSILAFSNKNKINNNKLFTYDINTNALNKDILVCSNAEFSTTNLLNPQIREENKEHILSADILFIDIDPHTGILEYEMLCWLKKNKFNGLILLDDIYLGKIGHEYESRKNEGHFMFDNLWSKISDDEKLCISHVGHASGTGIVCFNFSNYDIIL